MQIRADYTKEELINEADPLVLTCHSLDKIKLLADFFWVIDDDEFETGNLFNQGNIHTMYDVLNDAYKEINYIVDVCNQRWREDDIKLKKRTQALKDCIAYLEDPDDKPDFKTMVAKLRQQLKN